VILAVGLTPAWQQILEFEHLQPGEVNRAVSACRTASGKVLNVGRALHQLGCESRAVSIVGGESGDAICVEFAAEGIDARWVVSESPTRICTTLLSGSPRETTELVENAGAVTAAELEQFADVFASEVASAECVVLTGSLPQSTPATYYRDLMAHVSSRVILDVRGPELLEAIHLRPWLVKPNRHELAATVQRELNDDAAVQAAMRELNERGAEWVMVTDGARPVWLTSSERTVRFDVPSVPTLNPIGCGDCLAAGLAAEFTRTGEIVSAVRYGIAAAAYNAGQLLPARLDRHGVDGLADSVHVVER